MTNEPQESAGDEQASSVGLVETRYARLFDSPNELLLENGKRFGPVTVAYETYGELSPQKDNAIFICHALTGDAHVAGRHLPTDEKPGWWDDFIGPGKGLDTNRYFVICANVLSGCKGTTGPSSADPETGKPFALKFPFVTVGDIVAVHSQLVRHLGIEKLLSIVGGSLGGMQTLEWAARFPEQINSVICLAAAAKLSAQGIAFNAVGRRAILADPNFHEGSYYDQEKGPTFGLALARMVAHITYLSEISFENKFGRKLQHSERPAYELLKETEFEVESYLHYQGQRFVERFDANSYLCLTHAMDYFDLAAAYGSLEKALGRTNARILIASYTSDWLFPTAQSLKLVEALIAQRKHVTFLELASSKGHDAFLLEIEQLVEIVQPFLEQTYASVRDRAEHGDN